MVRRRSASYGSGSAETRRYRWIYRRGARTDPVYAKNIGVDIDNLYISQPDNGEQALEITETMVRSGAVDIVIVDSVAALVPKAEIDGDMGRLPRRLMRPSNVPGVKKN